MRKLNQLVNELESKISFFKSVNPKISAVSVGWQIEHSLKTISLIISALENSDPKNYKWKFNKVRFMIFLKGSFPRGKVKAPKTVQPSIDISIESLKENFIKVRNKLEIWSNLDKNSYFAHPYFGDLNKKSALWMLTLHTKHHLKIINEIVEK